MEKIKVSIITATYNSEKYILDTYKSIICQTHQNWEWLITDDCSTDKTLGMLIELSKHDKRIKVFSNNTNKGAAISRNNSIEKATGEYLAFIDSDDLWYADKIEKQLSFMNKNNVYFSFTSYCLIDESGFPLDKYIDLRTPLSVSYKDMLKKRATLGCSTVMLRKFKYYKIEMPNLRTGQDYATWLKILKGGERAYRVPECLVEYRIVSNSISRNKLKKSLRQWEIYRNLEKINIMYSTWCFLNYAFRAVIRK